MSEHHHMSVESQANFEQRMFGFIDGFASRCFSEGKALKPNEILQAVYNQFCDDCLKEWAAVRERDGWEFCVVDICDEVFKHTDTVEPEYPN